MFGNFDKRQLYWLIDQYLAGKLDAWDFSGEYHDCYDVNLDYGCLSKKENDLFSHLSLIAGRFSPYKEDHESYPGFFSTEEKLRTTVLGVKEGLRDVWLDFSGIDPSRVHIVLWKEEVDRLEEGGFRSQSIDLMLQVIESNPDELDAYLIFNYLLVDSLISGDCDSAKYAYYAQKLKDFFKISYEKFCKKSDYLFFTGITGLRSVEYFGFSGEELRAMIATAHNIDPKNILYSWGYYVYVDMSGESNIDTSRNYAKEIILQYPNICEWLVLKGPLGKYVLGIIEIQAEV